MIGLYKIINKINSKFYIGSSDNIERRFGRHLLDLLKNRHDNIHLQNAWNKYGKDNFNFQIYKICEPQLLLEEEQKELNVWVGKEECYNIRKDAKCPVAIGEHRSEEIKRKISETQKGIPRWTEDQKKQMSVNRKGRKHRNDVKEKMKNRSSSYENIKKAQKINDGRIYTKEHCLNIAQNRKPKTFNLNEIQKIKSGVRKAIKEGRYHKNKVPLSEYETIKSLYLSGSMNQRKLAFRYGITPPSMAKLLKRLEVK